MCECFCFLLECRYFESRVLIGYIISCHSDGAFFMVPFRCNVLASPSQDDALRHAVSMFDGKNWKEVARHIEGRTDVQCLHRWQKVLKPGLIKGPWTFEVRPPCNRGPQPSSNDRHILNTSAHACVIISVCVYVFAGGRHGHAAGCPVRLQTVVADCSAATGPTRETVSRAVRSQCETGDSSVFCVH